MEIDEIYTAFTNELAELELYRSAVNETTQQELKRFSEYAKQTSDTVDVFPPYQSTQVMTFYDPRTGEVIPYSFNESVAEDRYRIVGKQKNRQYCWLLVEAYEEFEDFIESIYAYVGKRDLNDWPMEDFGNIKFSELTNKDFRWYLDTVRKKYGQNTKLILNKLRSLYNQLETIENNNALGINLRLAIELIENLRHQIVHARGKVENVENFCKRILSNCGLWNNGNPKHEFRQFIELYLWRESDVHNISLVEIRASPNKSPLNAYYDICGPLLEYMMAYAVEIRRCVEGV